MLITYPREEDFPGAIRELDTPEAALAVAPFRPVTLRGELDTGEPVTVLHARNNGEQRMPKYVGDNCVHGALVSGPQQLYSAVRFRPSIRHWRSEMSKSA